MKNKSKHSELVNDLVAIQTVMDEIWKYHPDNADNINIIDEYESLKMIKQQIQEELKEIEN